MAKNESKTLNKSFETNTDSKIMSNLENLKGLGIDSELFAQFKQRVEQIVLENPGSEDIVVAELGKTQLSVENLFENYNRKFRSILDTAANDGDFYLG